MARILIVYSTTDGHTRTISMRMQRTLEGQGHEVTLASIDEDPAPQSYDKVIIGASIRYGHHRPEVEAYIQRNEQLLNERPNAFFSVNVVARKPGKDRPETNPYLQKFLKRIHWRPRELAVFAGRLDYPRYSLFDRTLIRMIMFMTKGPTDPHAVIEFTDWQQVEAFARRIGEL